MKKRCTSYINLYSNKIPNDIQLELMSLDPTNNECTYTDWLFKQYLLGLKKEDYYKVKNALIEFHREKTRLPKELRDINKYKTYSDLMDMLDDQLHPDELGNILTQDNIEDSDITLLYDGPYGTLSIPKTKEASCRLGKGTRWCTAAESSDNMFESYNSEGPLYVWYDRNWNKGELKRLGNKSKKFQFHFPSCQFMDELDKPISRDILRYYRNEHVILSKFFKSHEEEIEDEYIVRYIFIMDIREGQLFTRALDLDQSLQILKIFNVTTFEELNGMSHLDIKLDTDDRSYLLRSIQYPNYNNPNKQWSNYNYKQLYRLLVEKDINISRDFINTNPYYRLYYTTYIAKQRDIELELIPLPWSKPNYVPTNNLVKCYLLLYSDINFAMKMLKHPYVFSMDYISENITLDELEYYINNTTDEQIYNYVGKSMDDYNNIYKICKIRGIRNKYLDEYQGRELQYSVYNYYRRDIIDNNYIPPSLINEKIRSFEIIYACEFREPTEKEMKILINEPMTSNEYSNPTDNNHMSDEQLIRLWKREEKQVKEFILTIMAMRGNKEFVLDNMDIINMSRNKILYLNVWKLLYNNEPSEKMERLFVPYTPDSNIKDVQYEYYNHVTYSKYAMRHISPPTTYVKRLL